MLPLARARHMTLPVPLTSLVGRQRQVELVRGLLGSDARLITILGPGGVGKTRLAIAVADDVFASFPDGVEFVPLAPIRDPAAVLHTLALAVGVKDTTQHDILGGIMAELADRHVLLVLDNVEHLLPAAPFIPDLLRRCPNLRIVVTSRAVLQVSGEHTVLVPPLELPNPDRLPALDELGRIEAVTLFIDRAVAAHAQFRLTEQNAPAVVAICVRLEGLPLAIELAAARIRVLSPQALLARLDQRLRVLTDGPRDAPDRLQSLRDAIGWSYGLLANEQQRLLRCVSVFAGGWTLEAAEAVAAQGEPSAMILADRSDPDNVDIISGLSRLIEHSLIQRVDQQDDTVRFTMLETIREFALEQLEASGEADAVRRWHAAYFLNQVYSPELAQYRDYPPGWYEMVATEHNNLRAAMEWAVAQDVEIALRLTGSLLRFWERHGLNFEGRRWLERALSMSGGMDHDRGRALFAFAQFTSWQGSYSEASTHFREALGFFRASGDLLAVANTVNFLGIADSYAGIIERAAGYYLQALELFRQLGDRYGTARALSNLGEMRRLQGDLDEAQRLQEEALSIHVELDSHNTTGRDKDVLHALGLLALEREDWDRAEACWFGEIDIARRTNRTPYMIAEIWLGLACVAAGRGQHRRAARLFGVVIGMDETQGTPSMSANDPVIQRCIALARGRLDDDAWTAAVNEGRQFPLEELFDYAMARDVELDPPAQAIARYKLTTREVEVLRLVAAGKSNRRIAGILFLSERTVERHIENIYRKLDLHNRAEATAFALHHNLG